MNLFLSTIKRDKQDDATFKGLYFAETENYRGWVAPEFHDLAMQFSRLQNARSQQGGAALASVLSRSVVDIYTGKKSPSEDWQADTLSVCYSTGKVYWRHWRIF